MRLGRAAMFAFRTSAALAMGACGTSASPPTSAPPPTSLAPPDTSVVAPYGAPPDPRPPEPPPPSTTVTPPESTLPETTVPETSERPRRRRDPDYGGAHALYGAPVPAYGAAPPRGIDGLGGIE